MFHAAESLGKTASEAEIFGKLADLCRRPGYAHAIAAICMRDNMIAYHGSMTPADMMTVFGDERLVRTEITTLLGLLVSGEIDFTVQSAEVLASYVQDTDALMADLHGALGRDMMQGLFSAEGVAQGMASLGQGAALREAIFYGGESAYSHQYRDFAPQKYERDDEWLLQNKGFSIQQARDVVRAMGELQNLKVLEAKRAIDAQRADTDALLRGFSQSSPELSAISGVPLDKVTAVLAAFTLRSDNRRFTSISDFNAVSATPLIPLPDGRVLLFQYYSIVEALYESPFYWMGADKAYCATAFMHRGDFTEALAAQCLAKVFRAENVHRNVNLVQGNKTIGEIDVLVAFGNRLVVVQTKSKRLTLEARKGNDGQLQADFQRAIQDSYDQGLLCAEHLLANDCVLRLADACELNLTVQPKEVFILNVVADHYPALSFQSRQFLQFESTEHIRPPFVMDVFLLDAMIEMLESPLRLLAYVRQRVQHVEKLSLSHELVALAYHLRLNLWLSDEMDFVVLGDDVAVDLDLAMNVRREGIPGPRTPPGILTRMAGTTYESLIAQIERKADPACLNLGFFLLTLNEDSCKAIDQGLRLICKSTRADNKTHDFTIAAGDEGVTIYCISKPPHLVQEQLAAHCLRRKYAQKAARWFGLCIDVQTTVLSGLEMDFPWRQSDPMDTHTAGMRKGTDAAFVARSPQGRVGRNDLCPCGSGRKFKRCHLDLDKS